jgi:ElaB/YqjD/DUF883 family membrane-anchored ribosome-binding protein
VLSNAGRTKPSSFTQFVRDRPLLVVGAGVALGMALGALLPWSRIEDELLGDQAERLKDGAVEMASEGYDKAKSVARRGFEAAREIVRGSDSNADSGDSATIGHPGQAEAAATDGQRHQI